MARIPEAEIERLQSEVSVERLVEASGIALKKSGKRTLGDRPRLFPRHGGQTPYLFPIPEACLPEP